MSSTFHAYLVDKLTDGRFSLVQTANRLVNRLFIYNTFKSFYCTQYGLKYLIAVPIYTKNFFTIFLSCCIVQSSVLVKI